MPLLDHFHPPLSEERHWESFHSKWANALVDELNQTLLPPGYFAEPYAHIGARVEIDAATFNGAVSPGGPAPNGATATASRQTWAPPPPTLVMPAAFPDVFEVQVFSTETGPRLVAAIELVSPANKDRAEHRRAFAVKCASCLTQGIALIVVDVVTNRGGNMHDEMARVLPDAAAFLFPAAPPLYVAAYRPIQRDDAAQIEAWLTPLAVGRPLPTSPLALSAELCLPIDLESTYMDARRRLRLG
ncbi:MAG TPA: DUF4058 family protein [Gemmataceae bacterium]|nr:DUF4058 family protein [Gemmataceae bacterium]